MRTNHVEYLLVTRLGPWRIHVVVGLALLFASSVDLHAQGLSTEPYPDEFIEQLLHLEDIKIPEFNMNKVGFGVQRSRNRVGASLARVGFHHMPSNFNTGITFNVSLSVSRYDNAAAMWREFNSALGGGNGQALGIGEKSAVLNRVTKAAKQTSASAVVIGNDVWLIELQVTESAPARGKLNAARSRDLAIQYAKLVFQRFDKARRDVAMHAAPLPLPVAPPDGGSSGPGTSPPLNRPSAGVPISPERTAAVTALVISLLLGAGVSISVAQAVANAIAQALQAGIDVTAQDIADAIADGKRQAGVTREVTLSGDAARAVLNRGVGGRIHVPDGERHDLEISDSHRIFREGFRGNQGRVVGIGPIITDEDGNITIGAEVEFDKPGSELTDDERDTAVRLAGEIDGILNPPPPVAGHPPTPPPVAGPKPELPQTPNRAPPTLSAPTGPPPKTIPDLERELEEARNAAWWAKWNMYKWGIGLAGVDYPTRFVDWTFGIASAFTGPASTELDLLYGSLRSVGKWLGRSLMDGRWSRNALQVGGEFAADATFKLAVGSLFKELDIFQHPPSNFDLAGEPARRFWKAILNSPRTAGQLADKIAERGTQHLLEWYVRDPLKNEIGLFKWKH